MLVSAVVPAHNEAMRIGKVLDALKRASCIQEIIVIDDGSTDGTKDVAQGCDITVFRNDSRQGKGQALERGASEAKGRVLFFCDADIEGLTPCMIEKMIAPVVCGDAEMSIGARKSKVRRLCFGYTYSPLLDGQRAVTRELWERIPGVQKGGYRVEAALNYHARTCTHQLLEISQATKEDKRGLVNGKFERYLMYGEIALAHLLCRLQIK